MDPTIGELIKSGLDSGPLGSLGDAWQALWGDRIASWRLKNAMALQLSINAEAERLGLRVDTSRVPEKYAFSWFEEATKQDEPELQILFARLLARASSGNEDAADRRLVNVLSELTPADAAIFQRVYSEKPFPDAGVYSETRSICVTDMIEGESRGWPRDWALALIDHYHPKQGGKSVENLIRVGLLESGYRSEGSQNRLFPSRDLPGVKTDWRRVIQSHTKLRAYLHATDLGSSLSNAVKE